MPPRGQFQAFTVKPQAPGYMPLLTTEAKVLLAQSLGGMPALAQTFLAIWDTGCTMTAISPAVVTKLGLKPFSKTEVHFGNESKVVPVYKVDIMLPNALGVLDVNVSEAANIRGADLLIGMDIINMGDFAVTNAGGTTCFSFRYPPAAAHIDYVKQSQANAQTQGSAHDRQNLVRHLKRKGKLR